MKKILITGSTGMVGKGVLLEALDSHIVAQVILINRSPIDIKHPKIKEVILKDFTTLPSVKDQLGHPDACFHCMGVSAMGLSEETYSKLTYDITRTLADLCFEINPEMAFAYVSGTGTDSSENGRIMWARVKGKTENYILSKGFGKALMFRPGFIIPEKGIKSRTKLYNLIYTLARPFFGIFKNSANITTTTKVGKAMINSLNLEADETHLENQAINKLAAL